MDFGAVATAMNEAFARLRWSLFKDISDIQVADDLESPTPKFSPFLGHPIAAEPATEVPLRELVFCINTLACRELPDDEGEPECLEIRRADGGTVTIGDVVEHLSKYCKTYQHEISEAKAPFLHITHGTQDGMSFIGIGATDDFYDYPDGLEVFFHGFVHGIAVGECALNVEVWAEGEDGVSVEEYWKTRDDVIPY